MSPRRPWQNARPDEAVEDEYNIFDPPSLDPSRGMGVVVENFGEEYPEDAPTVMAWSVGNLRAEAAWLLGSGTPPPMREEPGRASEDFEIEDQDRNTSSPKPVFVKKLRVGFPAEERSVSSDDRAPVPTWLLVVAVSGLCTIASGTLVYLLT